MTELKIKRNIRNAIKRAERLLKSMGYQVIEFKSDLVSLYATRHGHCLIIKIVYKTYWTELIHRLDRYAKHLPENINLELWVYEPGAQKPLAKVIWPLSRRDPEIDRILKE